MARGLVGALALALLGCPSAGGQGKGPAPRAEKPAPNDPTAEDYVGPKLPEGRVLLGDAFGGVHRVEVEIAATPASRVRGLMWRTHLPEGRGMLFIFPEEEVQGFWMRNTLIPLDMIFIDKERRVVGVVRNAEPRTLTSRTVGVPSTYVLEVPGGWTEKIGLKVGSTVELEGTSMVEVVP